MNVRRRLDVVLTACLTALAVVITPTAAATRYPVPYSLHGNRDLPNTTVNQRIAEKSTRSFRRSTPTCAPFPPGTAIPLLMRRIQHP